MNVSGKPRLHLIGAKGQLGSHLIEEAKTDFEIVAYSSKPSQMGENYTIPFYHPIQDVVSNVCENEPIIFLSHSNARKDIELLKQLLKELEGKQPHLIFISTMAIYSAYKSSYSEIKKEFEKLVQSFSSFSIIRLGFVFGRSFGGLSQVFSKLAQKKMMVFPHDNTKTGVVTLESACEHILKRSLNGPSWKIEDHYHVFLSIRRVFNLFGFRGKAITLPSISYVPIRIILQSLRIITPVRVQSLLSISFFNSNSFGEYKAYPYLRCFIFADYARLFGSEDLWQLRHHIRKIESNNSVSSYIKLSRQAQFMFLYRIKEIIETKRDQQDRSL